MTLLGFSLAQLSLIFGALGGAVTVLYILRLRRRRVLISFSRLWQNVLQEKESTSLFRRLKRLLSLLLQLLFLFLLTAALGDPRLSSEVLQGRQIVLLLDTSASMKAVETVEGKTRLALAVEKSKELVRGLGGADALMIVRMDSQVTPLTSFTGDEVTLLEVLTKIQASDTRADLARALSFCADALRPRKHPLLVLVGDGAYPKDVLDAVLLDEKSGEPTRVIRGEKSTGPPRHRGKNIGTNPREKIGAERQPPDLDRIDLRGIPVRYLPVGSAKDNIGIVAFNARRYAHNKLSCEIFLEVINYRDRPADVDLQILADGQLVELQPLKLQPRQKARFTCAPEENGRRKRAWCDLAGTGELLEARLSAPGTKEGRPQTLDAFPPDDRAWALLPRRQKQKVLLVTRGNLFLEGALLLNAESIDLSRVSPERYSPELSRRADALILDGFFPEEPPQRPYLLLNPPDAAGPFRQQGRITSPDITEQNREHPVMRWVTLKDVNIGRSVRFERGEGIEVLAASTRDPVMVAYRVGKKKAVAIGFDVRESDLPLRVAFPLIIINALDWFSADEGGLLTDYRTGETWAIPLRDGAPPPAGSSATITTPSGRTLPLPYRDGRLFFYGTEAGPHTLHLGRDEFQIAANLDDEEESDITPGPHLIMGSRRLEAPTGFGPSLRREIWIYLLLAALGLSLLEWLTYNRRITV